MSVKYRFKWGKQHPMRMVGAAAVLIAASGFLYKMMRNKAAKAAAVVKVAKKAKAGIKARVKKTVKALTKVKTKVQTKAKRMAMATT